ncbi:ABC transporter ATP-binding protein [Desulfoluna butyratoxydans]|uniref:Abc transporter-like n=1 Tax=Desulfoluna butyratoxydans TaxID=231438 RepID=A0A4U8YQQ5_9BACT|nr:ABC transporter ATP-binding protein [Desulfoluna butyratoxydans]VFQ46191.1 abc transporter-like [Desulfoluna butyratoxydans]
MTHAPQNIVTIENLSKTFTTRRGETVTAVTDINLAMEEHSFTCIVGPSGCGKSTILRIASGLEKATEGTVHYRGAPVIKPCEHIGLVFQEYSLFPWLTARDNVASGLRFAGADKETRHGRAMEFLGMVGMTPFAGAYPHELSGGMKQRVAIARALATNPDLLFMDEPFGALDAHTRILLQQELLNVWEMTRKTIVLVTHSVDEAVFLADRIVIMTGSPGRIRNTLDVDLERPRRRSMPRFGELTDHILKELEPER